MYTQAELPQYRLGTQPRASPWLVWLLARVGYVSPFQEAVATRKLLMSNAKAKQARGRAAPCDAPCNTPC